MFDTIALAVDPDGIATLTLNRPKVHNALSGQMIEELTEATHRIAADSTIRAVILTGAGASFCAGGDLNWMCAQMAADRAARLAGARGLARMLTGFNSLPKPVIAQVRGMALGGGVGLCCVSDLVLADATAEFGLTETRLGLIPATIGPFVIARMGQGAARQVFMSSERFGAPRARDLGIVSEVHPAADLPDRAREAARAYLSCAPGAVADAKRLALELGGGPTPDMIEASVTALVDRWESDEAQSGIAAFFDKTPPPWAG